MIKAIIFDLGGVVLDMKPLLDKAVHIFQPSDEDEFWKEINLEAIPLCKGDITIFEFWKRMAKRHKKKISEDILRDLWIKDYRELISINKKVQRIVESLKESYKIGMISNIISEHASINKKLGVFDMYDVVMLSNEVKLTKDKKEIFLLTAEKLKVLPQECIFVDDIEKFVNVANSVGMKAILYKSPSQLQKELTSLLGKTG